MMDLMRRWWEKVMAGGAVKVWEMVGLDHGVSTEIAMMCSCVQYGAVNSRAQSTTILNLKWGSQCIHRSY